MSGDLRANLRTILEEFPTDAARPSDVMSRAVSGAFDELVEGLSSRFAVRASASYEIQHNAEYLESRAKLPMVDFAPQGTAAKNDRNPRLRVLMVFPKDMRGVFLLLTDVRGEGVGPSGDDKTEQRERVRALLGRESELAWQFESGTPRVTAGEGERGDKARFAVGSVFYRFYEAEGLPKEAELLKDIDALLRLREIYVEKLQSRDLLERSEPAGSLGASEGERSVGPRIEEPRGGVGREGSAVDELPGELPETRNLILYGPPGTGKTWSTARRAVELCGELGEEEEVDSGELMRRYRRLRSEGRIEFVTFHQSFGYEEFVEGIRPVLSDRSEESEDAEGGEVEYQCKTGVFKRIALLAASEGLDLKEDDRQFEARWRGLQKKVEQRNEVVGESITARYRVETVDNDRFRLVRIDGASGTTYKVEKKTVKRWWNQRHRLGSDFDRITRHRVDSILSRPGNFTPNWVLYRLLVEMGEVDAAEGVEVGGDVRDLSQEKRIADAATYLDERRGERAMDAFSGFQDARPYVLIIDEVNRGNISKILGELITLLEPSKRLTGDDELLVKLPYSKDTFGVPPNLHVLGTMNTADRSIALLDAALRRRFEYEEMMPEPSVVVDVLGEKFGAGSSAEGASLPAEGLNDEQAYLLRLAPALLETINERIEFLYDRDHQIGHSYFLEATSLEALRDVFLDQVIPLLQEYFYGTWHQLGLVLGCPHDRRGNPERDSTDSHVYDEDGSYRVPMIRGESLDEQRILRMDHEDYEDQLSWEIHPDFVEGERLREFFEGVLPPERVKDVKNGGANRRGAEDAEEKAREKRQRQ